MSSTLPLHPTDDGWPYPDGVTSELVADVPDFDALEFLGPHSYDSLTAVERQALFLRFGLDGTPALDSRELAHRLGVTRSESSAILGAAIDKVRMRLLES